MREIKFRVWDKYSEYMLNDEDHGNNNLEIVADDIGGNFTPAIYSLRQVNNEIKKDLVFMQYTGLKDKNGREIYEGDIIKSFDDIFEIVWDNSSSAFIAKVIKGNFTENPFLFQPSIEIDKEVIGNIYENPELINSSKNKE